MATRLNGCTNPYLATGATGITGGSRVAVVDAPQPDGVARGWAAERAADDLASMVLPEVDCLAGEARNHSLWVRPSSAGQTITLFMQSYAGATFITGHGSGVAFTPPAGVWTRIDRTQITASVAGGNTADATRMRTLIRGAGGGTFQVSLMLFEGEASRDVADTTPGSYFDGASPGAAWNGTAGNSTSTLTVPDGPALPALVQASPVTFSGAGSATQPSTIAATLPAPATAGNLVWFAVAGDKDLEVLTGPAGFSRVVYTHTGDVSLLLAYKVAAGGETTISASTEAGNNLSGSDAWIGEYAQAGADPWAILGDSTAANDGTTPSAKSTGTTGTLTGPGRALAGWGIDSTNTEGTASYSNGYAERANPSSGASGCAGLWLAEVEIPAGGGTTESTLTRGGAGITLDQMGAGVAVFGRQAAGPPEVTGSALVALGFTAAAAGGPSGRGSALVAVAFTAAAAGRRSTAGTAAAHIAFSATATGRGPAIPGAALVALGFSAAAAGVVSQPAGVPLLPKLLGPGTSLLVEAAWGADLGDADGSGWSWADITRRVRQAPGISAKLGRADEASTSQPAQLGLVLDNTSGDYSLGGQSPLWPNVRRNTPVRVRVNPGDGGGYRVLGLGFADGFTPGWDSPTGRIPIVNLSASGTLRRLAQGDAPVMSAYRRAMIATPSVRAYWPCEEGRNATRAPAVRGGGDMIFTGQPKFGANDDFVCSAELPELGTGWFVGDVATYPQTGQNQVRFLLSIPSGGLTDGTVLAYVWTTGSMSRFDLVYSAAGTGNLSLYAYNANGTLNQSAEHITFDMNGNPRRVSVELTNTGANLLWRVGVISPPDGGAGYFERTITARDVGRVTKVEVAPNSDCGGVGFGHLTVQNAVTSLYEASGPLRAFAGEWTTSGSVGRLERVAAENSVPIARYTAPAGTLNAIVDQTGPQLVAPLLDLFREAEATDQGQLWDGRDPGLSYTTRRYRELGTTSLTIDAAAGELTGSFAPVDDDQRNRNRVSAQNAAGITATYEDTAGPLGTARIGIYDSSVDMSNYNDAMALHYASWHVHLGTTQGYRFPSVTVAASSAPHLMAAALDVIPGDRIDVTGLDVTLAGFPSGTVSLIVEGISQEITSADWTITFQCSPFSPWGIAHAAASSTDTSPFILRGDTDGCTLTAARAAGATTLAVTTPAGPRWTTTAADYPITLDVGGIPVVATACTGTTGAAQTLTVQPLAHARTAGMPVKLHDPRPLGL